MCNYSFEASTFKNVCFLIKKKTKYYWFNLLLSLKHSLFIHHSTEALHCFAGTPERGAQGVGGNSPFCPLEKAKIFYFPIVFPSNVQFTPLKYASSGFLSVLLRKNYRCWQSKMKITWFQSAMFDFARCIYMVNKCITSWRIIVRHQSRHCRWNKWDMSLAYCHMRPKVEQVGDNAQRTVDDGPYLLK